MSKNVTNKLFIKRNLSKFKMEEGRDLGEYIARFNQNVSDLFCVDVKLDDQDKVIMLICYLIDVWKGNTRL